MKPDDTTTMTPDLGKAIENEFSCHYLADELPPLTEQFIERELPGRASASAARLYQRVGPSRAGELISLLRAMRTSANHPLTRRLSDDMIDWTEEENWPAFVRLLELIADGIEHKLAPDPR